MPQKEINVALNPNLAAGGIFIKMLALWPPYSYPSYFADLEGILVTKPYKTKGWGIIGASTIARQYMIKSINAQPDAQVVALMSRSARRGRRLAHEFGIARIYTSLEDILQDPAVDVIYVCTTNERHKAETLAAASAGKHVLCEKPLALTLEDALEMVKGCQSAGVVLGTNHHLRNAVTHRKIRSLIMRGAIGTPLAARVFHAVSLPPYLRTWRIKDPSAGGGVTLDITVHDTDTLRFLLDDEVEDVMAYFAQQGLAQQDLEDSVMGVMRFSSGLLAQFHDAFTIGHAGTGLQIHGTTGSLIAEDVMTQQPVGRIYRRKGNQREAIPLELPEDLYERSVRIFSQAVEGQGRPAATDEDGVRSLAVALAVRTSAQTGARVTVRYA